MAVNFLTGFGAVVADDTGFETRGDGAFNAVEGTAGDEEDVACVDLYHGLFGVFAASLGRHVDDSAFE